MLAQDFPDRSAHTHDRSALVLGIFVSMLAIDRQTPTIDRQRICLNFTEHKFETIFTKSLVLEASDSLRTTGFAFLTWTNAWKALDAIGIGDSLRQQHYQLYGGDHEIHCVVRKTLLEALSKELPSGTIRFKSKVVSIQESGFSKLLHLSDGTVFRTKVLIGCDGVNSGVAKWLRFKAPRFTGRYAIRGCCYFKNSHDFEPKFLLFFGDGVRSGFVPCDAKSVYWFFTWTPSNQEKALGENPAEMKQFVLSKLGKLPSQIKAVIENTSLDCILASPLRYRNPLELLLGNISQGNVCVAGDALHPMTPDLGQGGCSALEDGVVLARCLAEALRRGPSGRETKEEEEYQRIEMGLAKYAKERKWRSIDLITTAYVVGFIQESGGKIRTFLRDKCMAKFLVGLLLKKADFDCGKLCLSLS